jgi:inosine-uridine nucleoside N-ribohydrolase
VRVWIDTDVGDNPDDTVALWCASRADNAELVGISTVDGNVEKRAQLARARVPDVEVVAGTPQPSQLANVDVLIGIGPWTNVAGLADDHALPARVVLMGGALGSVRHRNEWQTVEHNVGADPAAAARLLAAVGGLTIVPLDATAEIDARPHDEQALVDAIPQLGAQLNAWRAAHGGLPLVLHDPAAVLIALGEPIARLETRRLTVDPDGRMRMRGSDDGPAQQAVVHIDADATRARLRALASRG